MLKYPKDLLTLIAHLRKLPGVGKKTAERYAFQLLEWEGKDLHEFAEGIATLKERVQACVKCGCLMDGMRCSFCDQERRDRTQLCIIASPRDAYAIEDTGTYRGLYHVLGALLSPLDGKTPDALNLPHLQSRIEGLGVKETILALDSTLEGDATSLYLKEQFEKLGIEVSRLALGLPLGSSLDFVDEGTLSQALSGRRKF
ncbi:MAG: recombination protein RecR [Chlamydiia bacterium]|nr:recombination protein RecR [Chlamydiia bacterium]